MRNITKTMVLNFCEGVPSKMANTLVERNDSERYGRGYVLRLHGNLIACRDEKRSPMITLAGYNTVTTRERLNGLLSALGKNYGIAQRKGKACLVWSLNGKEKRFPIFDDALYTIEELDQLVDRHSL